MDGVKQLMAKLGGEPVAGWDNLSAAAKQLLSSNDEIVEFGAEKLWNAVLSDDDGFLTESLERGDIRAGVRALNIAKKDCSLACSAILLRLKSYLIETKGENAIDIIRFFANYTDADIVTPSAPVRQSAAALAEDSEVSSCAVGDTLDAAKIHHKMFGEGSDLDWRDKQKFIRFIFPSDDDVLFKSIGLNTAHALRVVDEGVNDLQAIRAFLSRCDTPHEPVTQALFVVFMDEFLKKIKGAEDSLRDGEIYTAQKVTGMAAITNVKMTVSKAYMKANLKKKRKAPGALGDENSEDAKSKEVHLSVQSDVVVWQGDVLEDQQRMFLDCKVNIEMKRYASMCRNKNRRELTQVSAQSLVRSKTLQLEGKPTATPKVLYSILTDVSSVYVLLHKRHDGGKSDQYWISRSEHEPRRVAAIIYWIFLLSTRDDLGEELSLIRDWECVQDNQEQDGSCKSNMESIDEEDNASDSQELHADGSAAGDKEEDGASLMVIDFNDESEDEEESEEAKWSPFYAFRNQRALGTILPLTSNMLNLLSREGQGGVEDDKNVTRVRSALNHDEGRTSRRQNDE